MREIHLTRRRFLRAAGTAIALPFLPSLYPRAAFAGDPPETAPPPMRMLFLGVPLGFTWKGVFGATNEGWNPETDGADYKMPEVHASLEPHRRDLSFIKGLRHGRYRADSHYGDDVFLTGADTLSDPSRAFTNTISCDQVAAESPVFAQGVRYRSLCLGIPPSAYHSSRSGGLSWTRQGIPIPPLTSPAQVFDLLFGADDMPAEARLLRLQQQRSVLDAALGQYRDIAAALNDADRRKLDEVATAVRDVEAELQHEQEWIATPKPTTTVAPPDREINPLSPRQATVMFDLIHAAFLTDSTRVITYHLPVLAPKDAPYTGGKHDIVHGVTPIQQQTMLANDRAASELLAALLGRLKAARDHAGRSILDHTIGAMGAGNWGCLHGCDSLPAMLFGHGGGKLVQGATRTYPSSVPLANVWLTLLRSAGLTVDSFADSTGVVPELLA
jgi:hypothetical protein